MKLSKQEKIKFGKSLTRLLRKYKLLVGRNMNISDIQCISQLNAERQIHQVNVFIDFKKER